MVTKQINLKNRLYYFWNDQIWINYFDAKNLKLDKKSILDINIYYNMLLKNQSIILLA